METNMKHTTLSYIYLFKTHTYYISNLHLTYTVKSDADLTYKKLRKHINYLIILRQRVSSNFYKLSQLITFYSDKKPIYEMCVIKQHAGSE